MKKNVIIAVIGVFVLLGAVGAGLYLVKQNQEIRKKAAPSTSIILVPSATSVKINDTFTVDVNIDTGVNEVAGAELYVSYDASRIKATAMTAGTFLSEPNVLGPSIDNTQGSIFYSLNLAPGVLPKSGSGTLATITFQALQNGSSQIALTNETVVVAVGENGQNVLNNKIPTTITITSATNQLTSATASPTPTPTSNPGIGGLSATASPTPPTASGSASTFRVTNVKNGQELIDSTPTFIGKAPANSTISLTISPQALTGTVTATSTGVWSYTPSAPLPLGSYTLTAVSTNTLGATQTVTVGFSIVETASLPDTGIETPILIGGGLGIILLLIGGFILL